MSRTVSVTIKEYIRAKALGMLGLLDSDISFQDRAERLTFVNNIDNIAHTKVREYNVWYTGDSDELLNFYTRANAFEYNLTSGVCRLLRATLREHTLDNLVILLIH